MGVNLGEIYIIYKSAVDTRMESCLSATAGKSRTVCSGEKWPTVNPLPYSEIFNYICSSEPPPLLRQLDACNDWS